MNPPVANTVEDKTAIIGSKILGIRKPLIQSGMNKGTDSSSRAIISKVRDILLSCKEIKSSHGDDEGTERPELSSKWIALLTMEKACLSTVSFEGMPNPKFSRSQICYLGNSAKTVFWIVWSNLKNNCIGSFEDRSNPSFQAHLCHLLSWKFCWYSVMNFLVIIYTQLHWIRLDLFFWLLSLIDW